VTRYLIGDVW